MFQTVREAKEYLVHRILAQADRDATPLSDIERKMLYFSETGWTLPNMMTISQEFDQAYDQDEYERKIGQIVRRMLDQHDTKGDDDHWDKAVQRLREEDHYLLVLIDGAFKDFAKRRRGDTGRLILAGVVVVAVLFPTFFFIESHVSNPTISKLIGECTFLALVVLVAFLANRKSRRSS
ncbi:MAG TPA: hypothetical protein VGI45_01115 [Terracidiphilus sp.]